MATFRVKQHDTTLPLSAETDITGATVTAFIRTMGVKTEIASTVPVNVTNAADGDFDVIVTDIAYGDFDLEVLVVKDWEEIRIPAMGYHRLLISPNLDDPLAGPYKPSATIDDVITGAVVAEVERVIPATTSAVVAQSITVDGPAKTALTDTISAGIRSGVPASVHTPRAVVAFSFDDGPAQDLSVVVPILDAKGVKGNFGAITSLVATAGYLTWAQLRALRDAGHEVLCHSATHPTLSGASAAVMASEIGGARATMVANGLAPTGFVWPNGQSDAAARAVARQQFLYAIGGAADGVGSKQPLHTYSIGRATLQSSSTLSAITARIDAAIAASEFLVFVSHAQNALDANGQSVLAGAIDYVKSKNVPIVTVGEGMSLVGNVLDAGDIPSGTSYAVIDGAGRLWAPGMTSVLATNTVTAATAPGDFPAGVVSYATVNSAGNTDWPVSGSGNIITDRTASSFGFVTQTFIASTGATHVRKATGGTTWGAWLPPAIGPVVSATNGITAATVPGDFLAGRVTYSAMNSSGNTDWPVTGVTANVVTDRTDSGGYGYVTQRFVPSSTNTEYIRRATNSTTWGAWTTTGVLGIAPVNTYNAATFPGNWPAGKVTHQAVSSAGNTDWPSAGVVGKVVTDRTDNTSYAYVTQRFSCDGKEHVRYATSSTVWGGWKVVATATP